MMDGIVSSWRNFAEEYRHRPIFMTFGVVMSAMFFMMSVLALLKIVRFIVPPHAYLFAIIRAVELALGIFALFGVVWLCYDRTKNAIRTFPTSLGILTVLTLGEWAFDGEVPFCGWEGVFGHIPWCP